MPTKEDKTLLGLPVEKWRKAYFSGNLLKELNKVQQEQQVEEADLADLDAYLNTLKEQEDRVNKYVETKEGKIEPPSVEEMMQLTDEQKEALKNWCATTKDLLKHVSTILNSVRDQIRAGKKYNKDQWCDIGMEVITYFPPVDQYIIYQEQLYEAEITRLLDNFRMSKTEAASRAKLTTHYKEYKTSKRLKETMLEFEMMCKRYAGIQF